MKGSVKWLVFGVAVMLFGAACADDDDFYAEITSIRVSDGIATVVVSHDNAQGVFPSDATFAMQFCTYPDDECFLSDPIGDFEFRGGEETTGEFDWDAGFGEFVAQVVLIDDGKVKDLLGLAQLFTVAEDTPEAFDVDEAASDTTVGATTTTTAATSTTSTTSTSSTSSTTSTTVKAVAATSTTAAPTTTAATTTATPTTTPAATSTSTTSSTTTTTVSQTTTTSSSTTTTTEYDSEAPPSTDPVSGVGEWIENDMTYCAYRGTMGCGIYQSAYYGFPDYGPVGQAGDMMTSYWGSPGEIAYSTYLGHSYGSCDNNGAGGCGWYYTATNGTYELGMPVP